MRFMSCCTSIADQRWSNETLTAGPALCVVGSSLPAGIAHLQIDHSSQINLLPALLGLNDVPTELDERRHRHVEACG